MKHLLATVFYNAALNLDETVHKDDSVEKLITALDKSASQLENAANKFETEYATKYLRVLKEVNGSKLGKALGVPKYNAELEEMVNEQSIKIKALEQALSKYKNYYYSSRSMFDYSIGYTYKYSE